MLQSLETMLKLTILNEIKVVLFVASLITLILHLDVLWKWILFDLVVMLKCITI